MHLLMIFPFWIELQMKQIAILSSLYIVGIREYLLAVPSFLEFIFSSVGVVVTTVTHVTC
jgi:hypothetical protein